MSCINFVILKINGFDVSQIPHEEAVQLFLKAKEPILVEVKRRSTYDSQLKLNAPPPESPLRKKSVKCSTDNLGSARDSSSSNQNISSAVELSQLPSWERLVEAGDLESVSGDGTVTATAILSSLSSVFQIHRKECAENESTSQRALALRYVQTATATDSSETMCDQIDYSCSNIPRNENIVSNHDGEDNDYDDYYNGDPNCINQTPLGCCDDKNINTHCGCAIISFETFNSTHLHPSSSEIGSSLLDDDYNKNHNDDLNPRKSIGYCEPQNYKHFANCGAVVPSINIEEITLKKSRSDEILGFTISYSSRNGSATISRVSNDVDDDDDDEGDANCIMHDDVNIVNVIDDNDDDDDDDIDELADFDYDEDTCADIYISGILPDSLAARDGRLRAGDQILQINGYDVLSKGETELLFNENQNEVTLLISRCIYTDDSEFLDSAVYCDDKDITHIVSAASGGQFSLYDCEQNTFSSKSSISHSDICKPKENIGEWQQLQQVQSASQTASIRFPLSVSKKLQQQQQKKKREQIKCRQLSPKAPELQTISHIDCGDVTTRLGSGVCDHANITEQLESVNKEISLLNSQISSIKLQNITTTSVGAAAATTTSIISNLKSKLSLCDRLVTVAADTSNAFIPTKSLELVKTTEQLQYNSQLGYTDQYDNLATLKPLQPQPKLICSNFFHNQQEQKQQNLSIVLSSQNDLQTTTKKLSKLLGQIQSVTAATSLSPTNAQKNSSFTKQNSEAQKVSTPECAITPKREAAKLSVIPGLPSIEGRPYALRVLPTMSFANQHHPEIEHVYETIPESDYDTDSYYSSPYENREKNRIEQWILHSQKDNACSDAKKKMPEQLHNKSAGTEATTTAIQRKKSRTTKTTDIEATASAITTATTANKILKEPHMFNSILRNRIRCRNNTNDDYENSSSAYNTGGSCTSNNQLTFELKEDEQNQSNSTLVLRQIDSTLKSCKNCQLHQQQIQKLQHHKKINKERLSKKHRNKLSTLKTKGSSGLVVSNQKPKSIATANACAESCSVIQQYKPTPISSKQKLFHKEILKRNAKITLCKNTNTTMNANNATNISNNNNNYSTKNNCNNMKSNKNNSTNNNNNSNKSCKSNEIATNQTTSAASCTLGKVINLDTNMKFSATSASVAPNASTTLVNDEKFVNNKSIDGEQSNKKLKNPSLINKLENKNESLSNQCDPQQQMVWKVKRRLDGTRYIVRRPIKNNQLFNMDSKLTSAQQHISIGSTAISTAIATTEDDDTLSEIKLGRYWTKEERKRHIEKSKEKRQHRQQQLALNETRINQKLKQQQFSHFTGKPVAAAAAAFLSVPSNSEASESGSGAHSNIESSKSYFSAAAVDYRLAVLNEAFVYSNNNKSNRDNNRDSIISGGGECGANSAAEKIVTANSSRKDLNEKQKPQQ